MTETTGTLVEGQAIATATHDCIVVIPTYNERDTIVDLIGKILELPRFRVLVVDDNSPDGTGTLVTDLSLKEPRVGLLPRSGKLGLGSAYIAGFRRALREGSQYIFEMDADFSHDPAYLPYLLQAVELHCDLAIGSRYVRGGDTVNWGFMRQFISRSGNLYAGLILQLPTTDSTSGFRCYHRRVLAALNLSAIRSNGYAFQIEMVYRTKQAGFRIQELPIIFPDRRVGKSKMSRHIVLEALINVWRLRLGLM